jgi:hypothetical protein
LNSDDPEAKHAAEANIKMGSMAIKMLAHFTGKTPEEMFGAQAMAIEKKINDYYRSIGREDAIK